MPSPPAPCNDPQDPQQYYQRDPHGFEEQPDDQTPPQYQRMGRPKKKKPSPSQKGANPWMGIVTWVLGLGVPALLGYYLVTEVFMKNNAVPRNPYPAVNLNKDQEAAAAKVGETIAQEITEGRLDDTQKRILWDAFTWHVQSGMVTSRENRYFIRDQIDKSWAGKIPGILDEIVRGKQRVPAKFVRVRRRDGYPSLLIRTQPKENRILYFDLLLVPVGSELKIADLYNCSIGCFASEVVRRGVLIEVPTDLKNNGPWLAVFGEGAKDSLIAIKNLLKEDILNRGVQALDSIDALPPELRQNPQIISMELKALVSVNDSSPTPLQVERYRKLLESPPVLAGHDFCTGGLLADFHTSAKDPKAAEQALRKAHQEIGGDPFIKVQIGINHLAAGDVVLAEAAATEAAREDARSPEVAQLRREIETEKEKQRKR